MIADNGYAGGTKERRIMGRGYHKTLRANLHKTWRTAPLGRRAARAVSHHRSMSK